MAAGGGKITRGLVTPGLIERMFGNRKQLDMGVSHFPHIRNQMMGKFTVRIKTSVRVPLPRPDVNFVNIERCLQPIPYRTLSHPSDIVPDRLAKDRGTRGCVGTYLVMRGIWVGFEKDGASVAVTYFVFIE